MKSIAVIIATLTRPSLEQAVRSVQDQEAVDKQLLVRYDHSISEYASRDMAIRDSNADYIAFLDDDAFYSDRYTLSRACKMLEKYQVIDGSVQGNLFGTGGVLFDHDHLGIGTALFMRRTAYLAVGGFKLEWGTEPKHGWRMDTILLYDIIRRFGEESYLHDKSIIVTHPGMMQSQWNPEIEKKFYYAYRPEVEKWILQFDPRLQGLIKEWEMEASSGKTG